MSIRINIPLPFQSFAEGREAVEVDGSTVGECLNHLITQFPGIKKMLFAENGWLLGYIGVYVNGVDAYPEDAAKAVQDGDELDILYMIDGG